MTILPAVFMALVSRFAPLFSGRAWQHVPILLISSLLTPGERLVTTALRAVGLGQVQGFQTYHRALNRAVGSHGQPHLTRSVGDDDCAAGSVGLGHRRNH